MLKVSVQCVLLKRNLALFRLTRSGDGAVTAAWDNVRGREFGNGWTVGGPLGTLVAVGVAVVVYSMLQRANLFLKSTVLHFEFCVSIGKDRGRWELGQLLGREAQHCLELCDVLLKLNRGGLIANCQC